MTFPFKLDRQRSPAERRAYKFKKQGGLCWWCKGPMTLDMQRRPEGAKPPKNYASFEHLQRRRDGGVGKPFNVVLACRSCNSSRDAGVQTSKPKLENVEARAMSSADLLALVGSGASLTRPQFGQLFSRGLLPNWPQWSQMMAATPLGNP